MQMRYANDLGLILVLQTCVLGIILLKRCVIVGKPIFLPSIFVERLNQLTWLTSSFMDKVAAKDVLEILLMNNNVRLFAVGLQHHQPLYSHLPVSQHLPVSHCPVNQHLPVSHCPVNNQHLPINHHPVNQHLPVSHCPVNNQHLPISHHPVNQHLPINHHPVNQHLPVSHCPVNNQHLPISHHPVNQHHHLIDIHDCCRHQKKTRRIFLRS